MVKLTPMEENNFAAYLERLIREYAADHVANGNWLEEESPEKARKQVGDLLPDGLKTKDHFIWSILEESSGQKIGVLWVNVKDEGSRRRAFGYDFWIEPSLRGKGYGKQSLLALDKKLKSMDVESMGIHVFGDNATAQGLYRKMGFEVTGIHMRKKYEK